MRILFLFLLLTLPIFGEAHPVSYKGSVGIMGDHSPVFSHNQLNYSFRHWFAMGIHHMKRPEANTPQHATLLTANFLLKRWNTSSFQANVYGVLGAGQSELSGTPEASGFSLVQFDIEDRKYYFLAKYADLYNENKSDLRQATLRAGIAPYIEKYDGIHSWFILEWHQFRFSSSDSSEDLTPLLRIFYRNLLFEIGQSFKGMSQFNYITHF